MTAPKKRSYGLDPASILGMMKSAAVIVCSLLVTLAAAQTRENVGARGSIYGIATNSDGQPAKGIVLTAYPLGVPLGTPLPATKTNDIGAYSFENIPWWGRFTVFASDEEAGYSQYSTGPSGPNPPEVTIDSDHPKAELNLYLPRKAGFLHINLINSKTNLPISSMHVELRKAADPAKSLFSIGCSSDHVLLIPPDENLLVHVTSAGFKEWGDSIGTGKLIYLSSGTQQTLIVELEPSAPSTSEEQRVFAIIRKTVEAGRSVLPNNVVALTFVPIADADSKEIVAMGTRAVVPLTQVLDWQSDFAQVIAVRLLAEIGTPETMAPLERALDATRWEPVRMSALYGLAAQWSPRISNLVQNLTHDENLRIRQIAVSILAERTPQDPPGR